MLFSLAAFALNLIAGLTCNFMESSVMQTSYEAAAFDDNGNVTRVDLDEIRHRQTYGLRYYQCSAAGSFEFSLYHDYDNLYDFYSPNGGLTSDEVENNPFNPFTDPDYSEQTENRFRAATAYAFLGVLIGGMTMLFVWLGTCVAYHRVARVLLGVGFTLASFFSFMMLTPFSSEMCEEDICVSDYRNQTRVDELDLDIPLDDICTQGCRIGPGAGAAIAAGIMWFASAVIACILADANEGEETATKTGPVVASNKQEETQALKPVVVYQYESEEQAPSPPHHRPAVTRGYHDSDEGLPQILHPGRRPGQEDVMEI
jgi:hypothetical protein